MMLSEKFRINLCSSVALLVFLPLVHVYADKRLETKADPLDVTQALPPQLDQTQLLNLGATGAKGWVHGYKNSTVNARQIYIRQVDAGSPAAKVLQKGDVILGVGQTPFSSDARIAFGRALTHAEESDGVLQVLRWRAGKTENLSIRLPALGGYSDTAPYNCKKSSHILDQGCKHIAEGIRSGASAKHQPVYRAINALALLAGGDAKYLPLVKQEAQWAASLKIVGEKGMQTWPYGYATIFLAEYIAAAGDKALMPELERLSLEIARGQSSVGSWGHSFCRSDGGLYGYGSMNQPGLSCTVAMLLARKAGVKHADLNRAIALSQRFLSFYIEKGAIPYGDHDPWIQTHDDNGKCGSATVMFDLLGDQLGTAFFSRMSLASHSCERDRGHTGNFFNLLWAMPGVSRLGPNATGAWLNEFAWYFDLARCSDGSFVYLGEPGLAKEPYCNWDCTGLYLLAYAMPLRKTYITGREPSCAPTIKASVAAATVESGRGFESSTNGCVQNTATFEQLLVDLGSWSPVIRERAANEFRKRKITEVDPLVKMLSSDRRYARYGACSALAAMGAAAEPAVPTLSRLLTDEDLWLRILAAQALAGIGDAAVLPDMLKLAAQEVQNDPRQQVQRYLSYSLFGKGQGSRLAVNSFDKIDVKLLYPAIEAILVNQNGQARSAVVSVFAKMDYEQAAPLMPAIYKAVVEPAPSGVMFADGIRMGGLELLARFRIREGLPLCIPLMDFERWGKNNRIGRCIKALKMYGPAARSELPELRKAERALAGHREAKMLAKHLDEVRKLIAELEKVDDKDIPELRPLPRL